MAPPRRKVLATAEETMFPPDEFADTHQIARAIKATGNNIYLIELPDKKQMLAELPARFRSTFWIKRGSFVVVDTSTSEERDNKIGGEIINIVRDEKAWRKAPFWPKEFPKQAVVAADSDSDEEESRVGKMPSSDEESDA
jgi:probable RNA-binding protein EIF1AD